MKYEEAKNITSDKTELLRFMFEDLNEGTFNRIFEIIIHNRFLKNYIDQPYFFQKVEIPDSVEIHKNIKKVTKKNDKYSKEKLVALNEYDSVYDGFVQLHPRIFVLPEYYMEGKNGSLSEIYVRTSVVNAMLEILDLVPEDYGIRVFDGFRTLECQKDIYNTIYAEREAEEKELPEYLLKKQEILDEHVANDIMPKYVIAPSDNPPSPHCTGGAVDCRICDINGIDLNYGCLYDDYSDVARLNFFEDKMDRNEYLDDYQLEALLNRRVTMNIYLYALNNGETNTYNYFSPFATEEYYIDPSDESIEFPSYGSCEKDNIKPDPKYTIENHLTGRK